MRCVNEQMTLASMSQLKIQNRDKFLRILLSLTGNVELDPGPAQQPDRVLQENICDNFKCRGMHFFHLNITFTFSLFVILQCFPSPFHVTPSEQTLGNFSKEANVNHVNCKIEIAVL